MSRAPAARRVAGFVAAAVFLATAVSGPVAPAGADGPNHAAVIVETGAAVHRVVVSFDADSISGVEALALVPGANPSVHGFSGLGAAVCALFGVGHPVEDCLGADGDPRFWAYWHVPAGSSGFDDTTFSRVGAGSVRVRDGDTDGWRFGVGEAPTFVQLPFPSPAAVPAPQAVQGPAAPPPDPGSVTPATEGSAPGPIAPGAGASTTSTTTAAPSGGSVAGPARTGSTSTTRSRAEVAARRASATEANENDTNGGNALSLVGFGAVLAMLAVGIFFARRARGGSRSPGP